MIEYPMKSADSVSSTEYAGRRASARVVLESARELHRRTKTQHFSKDLSMRQLDLSQLQKLDLAPDVLKHKY